jgi:hypothetical protein
MSQADVQGSPRSAGPGAGKEPSRATPWTLEAKLEALERVERIERVISDIFEAKGLGAVKVTRIDWLEGEDDEEAQKG